MSFLTQGNTRKPYTADSVIELMPKLFISFVVKLVEEKTTLSIEALRRLINFMRLYRMLIELKPEAEKKLTDSLNDFQNDDKKRHKNYCSSLGDILVNATISKSHTIKNVLTQ